MDTHVIQEIKNPDAPSFQPKLYIYEYSYMHKSSFLDLKTCSMKYISSPKTMRKMKIWESYITRQTVIIYFLKFQIVFICKK